MWLDARQLPQGQVLDCDVCIVGAGAAGITIARELAGSGLSVLLAEAGGADYDDASQAFYKGRSIGLGLDPETTRLRQLGGSTNHWGGRSHPFEADDFAERPWVPHSGWPFARGALEPFYGPARAICSRITAWSCTTSSARRRRVTSRDVTSNPPIVGSPLRSTATASTYR